jgi:mRNA interferase YafQ
MYTVKLTRLYKKSLKRIKFSGDKSALTEIEEVVDVLSTGKKLSLAYKDHYLGGDYKGYRECHIRPDLLLVYQISDNDLILVNVGSHSHIFE